MIEPATVFKMIVSFITIQGHGYAMSEVSYTTMRECEDAIPAMEQIMSAHFHGRVEFSSECIEEKPGQGV